MEKKMEKIVIALLGILLVGSVSAGILDYFGVIEGSVTVSAPEWYLSNSKYSVNGNDYNAMTLGEFDDDDGEVSFTGKSETTQWFVTESLGVDSFYEADFGFDIEACAENNTLDYLHGNIVLELYVLAEDGIKKVPAFCSAAFGIDTVDSCLVDDYDVYHVECSANGLDLDSTDRFLLVVSDGSLDITYRIKMDGDSKVEVVPR